MVAYSRSGVYCYLHSEWSLEGYTKGDVRITHITECIKHHNHKVSFVIKQDGQPKTGAWQRQW